MNIKELSNKIIEKANKRKPGDFVKSPLNYTGNKFRLLSQFKTYQPSEINVMIDMFCGGATVGLNSNAKKVYFVDNNPKVINLLKFLANSNFNELLEELILIIKKFELSLSCYYGYKTYKNLINDSNLNNGLKMYNKSGFNSMRDYYNSLEDKTTKEANQILYLLIVYSFNNDIRFSKQDKFNLPVGKTDLNLNNVVKLKEFIKKINNKKYEFICSSFNSTKVKNLVKKCDYVYMDPPYLITTAVYNESNQWNNELEYKLLDFVEELIIKEKNFMLSNVIEKQDRINEPLSYWTKVHENQIEKISINQHYRSASYNKKNRDNKEKEIIIIPNKRNLI